MITIFCPIFFAAVMATGTNGRLVPRPVDICSLPKAPGLCLASFQRYYYSKKKKTCLRFEYGGCRGNANRFETKEACEERCSMDPCSLPMDPGLCLALTTGYYYYSKEKKACLPLDYGGCLGNANKFFSKAACQQKCLPQSCVCPKLWDPVCGEDGVTYGNRCQAECEDIKIVSPRECPEACLCPKIYKPVCGEDGRTYSNRCKAECAFIRVISKGPCEKYPPICACTGESAPVCGEDKKTYKSACEAECASVKIFHLGRCIADRHRLQTGRRVNQE